MEFFVRLIAVIIKLISIIIYNLLDFLKPKSVQNGANLPLITDNLLKLSIAQLQTKLRARELTSTQLIEAYIGRIKAVNGKLNAVVAERFADALLEAKQVDEFISSHDNGEVEAQFVRQPLFGLPMTVKESCALAGMPLVVGSLQRVGSTAARDGAAVAQLRAAGAIPLLVSANPEYCYSIETFSFTNGRCVNPYDFTRVPGGSSGGEGALNGAGATLFGVGSDVGGSIRIPSLFCGVFGHKPSAAVVSIEGHFPNSTYADLEQYLTVGPITRFSTDLALLLDIMCKPQLSAKLALKTPVELTNLKVYYQLGFDGLNGLTHQAVDKDICDCIMRAVRHFLSIGVPVSQPDLSELELQNSMEIGLAGIAGMRNLPYLMEDGGVWSTLRELGKSLLGLSHYTSNSLIFELNRRSNAFMAEQKIAQFHQEAKHLRQQFCTLLGENGVLLFPTFHLPAIRHKTSVLALWGIDYTLLFNILGLPVTHIPMGLGKTGLPIGFSVIAAPFQDRLCLRVANEMEQTFGGWTPPINIAA